MIKQCLPVECEEYRPGEQLRERLLCFNEGQDAFCAFIGDVTPEQASMIEIVKTSRLLKRIGRSKKAIGKRILFLVDGMAVCLAFSTFRAKSVNLLAIIRNFSAWSLSRRIFLAIRWIPSERNSADAPSRYFDSPLQ